VTDYGEENPLLMDYFGFQPELYQLKFKSRGDSALSRRVVELYKEVRISSIIITLNPFQLSSKAGQSARTTSIQENRGLDGRGFRGPGLDHGVFVPFRLMFGEEFTDVPIVQVSIDQSMSPEKNWALGKVVSKLRSAAVLHVSFCYDNADWLIYYREEGILILSGGLTAHNLRDTSSFSPITAKPIHKEFDKAILDAVSVPNVRLALVVHSHSCKILNMWCSPAGRTQERPHRSDKTSWIPRFASARRSFRPAVCRCRRW